jgi:glutathione S-transferase
MDLKNKAPWHVAINGGFVPFLEVPSGEFIDNCKVIIEYANDAGKDQGLELFSKDPVKAAHQRFMIENFVKLPPYIVTFFNWRGDSTNEKVIEFRDKSLPAIESFVKTNLKGKPFFGGDKPDMVDIFYFPNLERNCIFEGTEMSGLVEFLHLKENAKTMVEYVQRMREFELFKTLVPTQESFKKMFVDLIKLPLMARTVFELRYLD